LVETRRVVGALEFLEVVTAHLAVLGLEFNVAAGNGHNHPVIWGNKNVTRINGSAAFDTRPDNWRIRLDTWHGLALHVRTHERALTVVVFNERNE
jgi:hypothetical protein